MEDDLMGDLRRSLSMFALVAILIVWAVVAVVVIIPGNFHKPLFAYLDDLRAGDTAKAYEALCTDSRHAMSVELFGARFDEQMRDIGSLKTFEGLRGDNNLGSVVVTGSKKTVLALTPMHKEGGKWRPCPTAGPLGELEPWP